MGDYQIPEKCKTCDMPLKFRPTYPGLCSICFQNRETFQKYLKQLEQEQRRFNDKRGKNERD